MIATTPVRTWELERTPDLIDVVSAARDAGQEVLLIERPMPEAVSVAARGRAGAAEKVVLAREVMAHGDGVVAAANVARSLRSAYPSCFIYLITGADGTAFVGASPELLVRRSGTRAYAQPMAGSVARGASESEDGRLAKQLVGSAKDAAEHALVSRFVLGALQPHATSVVARPPEVVRFTNIQHL